MCQYPQKQLNLFLVLKEEKNKLFIFHVDSLCSEWFEFALCGFVLFLYHLEVDCVSFSIADDDYFWSTD